MFFKRLTLFFTASFEWFRDRCNLTASINENKDLLKDKISEAKLLGERANQSRYLSIFTTRLLLVTYFHNRNTINYLKNTIESIRKERLQLLPLYYSVF